MSALGELAGDAVGALAGGIWKVAAIVLLVLLLATGGGAGFGWWLAAHDRDQARADLKAEQIVSGDLRAAIGVQNVAVAGMATAKETADVRRVAAEQVAAANGKRLDRALDGLASAKKAVTCDEAMPAVNKLWKDVQ